MLDVYLPRISSCFTSHLAVVRAHDNNPLVLPSVAFTFALFQTMAEMVRPKRLIAGSLLLSGLLLFYLWQQDTSDGVARMVGTVQRSEEPVRAHKKP